jgi:hypothetical protein
VVVMSVPTATAVTAMATTANDREPSARERLLLSRSETRH